MSLQKSPSLVESEFQHYMEHYSKSTVGVSPESQYEASPVVKASQPQFNTNDLGGNFDLSDVSPALSSSPSIKERAALFSGASVSSSSSTPGSVSKYISGSGQSSTPAFTSTKRPSSSIPPLRHLDIRPPSQIAGNNSTPQPPTSSTPTSRNVAMLQRVHSSQPKAKSSFASGGPPPGGVAAMSPLMMKQHDPLSEMVSPQEFSTTLLHCCREVFHQVDNGLETLRKLLSYIRKFSKASQAYVQSLTTPEDSFMDEFTVNMRNHIEFHKNNQYPRKYTPNYDRCVIVLGIASQIEELNLDYRETMNDFASVIEKQVLPVLTNTLRDCEQSRKPLSVEQLGILEQGCYNDRRNVTSLLLKGDQFWVELLTRQKEVEAIKEKMIPTRSDHDASTAAQANMKKLEKLQKDVRELEAKTHKAFKALDQGIAQYQENQQKLISFKVKTLDSLQAIEHKRLLALNQALPVFEKALKSLVMFKNSTIDFAFSGHPLSALIQGFSSLEHNRDIKRYILEFQKIEKEEPLVIDKPCETDALVQSDHWKKAVGNKFMARGLAAD